MLDVVDFIKERGGNPEAIRESQRRRNAPEEVVDEVIALYEEHRKSSIIQESSSSTMLTQSYVANYAASQINTKINTTQKEIGAKRKVSYVISQATGNNADTSGRA